MNIHREFRFGRKFIRNNISSTTVEQQNKNKIDILSVIKVTNNIFCWHLYRRIVRTNPQSKI